MALNVQADLRSRLASALSPVEVRVRVPENRPDTLVVIRREGGGEVNEHLDRPGIGIWCWAPSEEKAYELAEQVAGFMRFLPFQGGYSFVAQEVMYSTPDPDTESPRWYLSYTLTTYEPVKE